MPCHGNHATSGKATATALRVPAARQSSHASNRSPNENPGDQTVAKPNHRQPAGIKKSQPPNPGNASATNRLRGRSVPPMNPGRTLSAPPCDSFVLRAKKICLHPSRQPRPGHRQPSPCQAPRRRNTTQRNTRTHRCHEHRPTCNRHRSRPPKPAEQPVTRPRQTRAHPTAHARRGNRSQRRDPADNVLAFLNFLMTVQRSMAETRPTGCFSLVSGRLTAYVCAAPYPKSGSYADP
jgi:hypothetical protein